MTNVAEYPIYKKESIMSREQNFKNSDFSSLYNLYPEKGLEKLTENKENFLKKLFEKELRSKARIVHFWLGNKIVKENKLLHQKEQITDVAFGRNGEESEGIQNIEVPEIVDIDYSEIKTVHAAKDGGMFKPYKDGFLIVRDDDPKKYHRVELSDYTSNPNAEARMLFHSLSFNGNTHYYLTYNDTKIIKENKNILNLYIVFKKAYKNKAFKITFKNNKYLNCITKLFNDIIQRDNIFNQLKTLHLGLPSNLLINYVESLGVLEQYESVLTIEQHGYKDPEIDSAGVSRIDFSKEKLLKVGYYFSVFSKFFWLITTISAVLRENKKEDFKKTVIYNFTDIDPKNFKLLAKKLVEEIDRSEVTVKGMIPFIEKYITEQRFNGNDIKPIEKLKLGPMEIAKNFIDLIISYKYTEEGISLPITGKINVENASEIDCLYYWNYINVFSLINGCLGEKDFPLFLDEGKIFNENKFYKHVHEFKATITKSPFRNPNEFLDLEPETKSQISEILTEAMDQTTGLLIPYNACVGLKDDPVIKYVRFIEYEKYIAIFAHDHNDRFIPEIYVKGEKEFKYWMYNSGQISDSKTDTSAKLLYLKLAACIRDWKVLIERDSTMSYQGLRIPSGVKSSKPRHMYLPRVTYRRSNSKEQKRREKIFFSESRKFSGERRAHRRKLQTGMKASKLQMLLAENENVYVPDGYTFVKKTNWGKIKKSKREIKYRTTSLNGLFFASDHEIEKAKGINELSPAGFEEKMEDYVDKKGWEVIKRSNYDGGIDIRAFKEFKDGTIKKLLVQCKHWKKPVGPDVIRELIGSSKLEKSDHEKVLMVITSSKFTFGAREAAEKENIELIDGDDLLRC